MRSNQAHSNIQTAIDGSGHSDGRGRKVIERLGDEVKRFLVMFLYLWVLVGLFVLHQSIILRQPGMSFTAQGFALVNALVWQKSC